jgi:hypothetical protein
MINPRNWVVTMATGTTLPRAMSAFVPTNSGRWIKRSSPSASIYEYTNQRGAGVLCWESIFSFPNRLTKVYIC